MHIPMQSTSRRCIVPVVLMRAGTSRGLFIKREHLPLDPSDWTPIILGLMGSLDGDLRQLDGIGGGSSTTSKVVVVSKSTRPGIDVDYTFIQVPVGKGSLDFSGNCGNMASGVGPFAVDEGFVDVEPGISKVNVRIYNENLGRLITETVEVDEDGYFQPNGKFSIAGFSGAGSQIDVSFLDPAGGMTGKLLPTAQPETILPVDLGLKFGERLIRASLVDAANPFVFVDMTALPVEIQQLLPDTEEGLEIIEMVRRQGAVRFGLAGCVQEAAKTRGTPKIALLSSRPQGNVRQNQGAHIYVTSYSMGKPHPSLQLTGAVCLASALCIPGSIAWRLNQASEISQSLSRLPMNGNREQHVILGHPSGEISVAVKIHLSKMNEPELEYAKVARTARRIFAGNAIVNLA